MNIAVATPTAVPPDMHATLGAQRAAFLHAGAPSLQERRADLTKLGEAIGRNTDRLAKAISADFGNRSRHETELGEIVPAQATIRHTLRHLAGWMRPKRVSVGIELLPATARIIYQPAGVVGIISPWNYPFNLSIVPLVAALAAGNRVMLKPSELTPRTSDFIGEFLAGLFPPDRVATSSRVGAGCVNSMSATVVSVGCTSETTTIDTTFETRVAGMSELSVTVSSNS